MAEPQQQTAPSAAPAAGMAALLVRAAGPFGLRFPVELVAKTRGMASLHPAPQALERTLRAAGFPYTLHEEFTAADVAHLQLPAFVWGGGQKPQGPYLRMPAGQWYGPDGQPCATPALSHMKALALTGAPETTPVEPTRLGALLLTFRKELVQVAFYGVLTNAASLSIPLFSMTIYDRVLPVGAVRTLWLLALGAALVLALDMLLRLLKSHLLARMAAHASAVQDAPLLQTLLRQRGTGTRWAEQLETMRLAHEVREQMVMHVLPTVADVPFVLMFLFAIVVLSPALLPVPLVLIALALVVQVALLPTLRRTAIKFAHTTHRRTALLLEILRAAPAARLANRQHESLERWEVQAHALHEAELQGHVWSGFGQYATITIAQLSYIGTLIVGADLVMNGTITIGALIAVSLLSSRAITPALHLIDTTARLQNIAASTVLLRRNLSWPQEALTVSPATPETLVTCKGSLQLQHTTVEGILTDINLHVRAGESWAITGGVGAGKSTLLHLLCGLVEPSSGDIRLDDIAITRMPVSELRRHVGILSQTPVFPDLPLRQVICGAQPVVEERLQEALAASGLGAMLASRGVGLEFCAGPNAERFSGGQRQMLALAVLFYANPRVLLLDEPSAPFDVETERQLVSNLKLWLKRHKPTLLVVTHREPVVELADNLLVLAQGKILAGGPKAKVLADMKALQRKAAA